VAHKTFKTISQDFTLTFKFKFHKSKSALPNAL